MVDCMFINFKHFVIRYLHCFNLKVGRVLILTWSFNKMHYLLLILFRVLLTDGASATSCYFPSYMTGSWSDSKFLDVEFTGGALMYFSKYDITRTGTTTNMSCYIADGNKYVVKTVNEVSAVVNGLYGLYYYYLCMEITQITDYSFYYYLQSDTDTNGERVTAYLINVTYDSILPFCNKSISLELFHIMVKKGFEKSALQTCSTPLLGDFSFKLTDSSSSSTGNWTFTDNTYTKVNITYVSQLSLATIGHSANNTLGCLMCVLSGKTYYTSVINLDLTFDEVKFYKFTCMVIELDGKNTTFSQRARICSEGQTARSMPSDSPLYPMTGVNTIGAVVYMEPNGKTTTKTSDCYPKPASNESSSNTAVIVAVVTFLFILLVIGIIVAVYCCKKIKRRTRVQDLRIPLRKRRFLFDVRNALTAGLGSSKKRRKSFISQQKTDILVLQEVAFNDETLADNAHLLKTPVDTKIDNIRQDLKYENVMASFEQTLDDKSTLRSALEDGTFPSIERKDYDGPEDFTKDRKIASISSILLNQNSIECAMNKANGESTNQNNKHRLIKQVKSNKKLAEKQIIPNEYGNSHGKTFVNEGQSLDMLTENSQYEVHKIWKKSDSLNITNTEMLTPLPNQILQTSEKERYSYTHQASKIFKKTNNTLKSQMEPQHSLEFDSKKNEIETRYVENETNFVVNTIHNNGKEAESNCSPRLLTFSKTVDSHSEDTKMNMNNVDHDVMAKYEHRVADKSMLQTASEDKTLTNIERTGYERLQDNRSSDSSVPFRSGERETKTRNVESETNCAVHTKHNNGNETESNFSPRLLTIPETVNSNSKDTKINNADHEITATIKKTVEDKSMLQSTLEEGTLPNIARTYYEGFEDVTSSDSNIPPISSIFQEQNSVECRNSNKVVLVHNDMNNTSVEYSYQNYNHTLQEHVTSNRELAEKENKVPNKDGNSHSKTERQSYDVLAANADNEEHETSIISNSVNIGNTETLTTPSNQILQTSKKEQYSYAHQANKVQAKTDNTMKSQVEPQQSVQFRSEKQETVSGYVENETNYVVHTKHNNGRETESIFAPRLLTIPETVDYNSKDNAIKNADHEVAATTTETAVDQSMLRLALEEGTLPNIGRTIYKGLDNITSSDSNLQPISSILPKQNLIEFGNTNKALYDAMNNTSVESTNQNNSNRPIAQGTSNKELDEKQNGEPNEHGKSQSKTFVTESQNPDLLAANMKYEKHKTSIISYSENIPNTEILMPLQNQILQTSEKELDSYTHKVSIIHEKTVNIMNSQMEPQHLVPFGSGKKENTSGNVKSEINSVVHNKQAKHNNGKETEPNFPPRLLTIPETEDPYIENTIINNSAIKPKATKLKSKSSNDFDSKIKEFGLNKNRNKSPIANKTWLYPDFMSQ